MIPYLTIALAVCSLFAIGYMNFVRPARRRRRAAMEIAPPEPRPNFAPNKPTGVTPPDGRVPRDLDRPYPRPAGGRRKPDKTCPVCGTGAETTPLDGKVLGWRAHGSCAEWLGEWQPQRPVPLPYSPDKSLIGYMEKGQQLGDPGPIELANRRWRTAPNPAEREAAFDALKNMIGLGETFARKACEDCGMEFSGTSIDLAASFQAHQVSGQCEQRRRKQAPAAIDEYCTCGMKFCGTPARIRVMLDEHHASGACPHSVKGRAADLRDLDGR